MLKKLKFNGSMKTQNTLLEVTPPKDVLFIIGDWNAKVGSQETPGVTGKFGLGVQNKAGQRLRVLPRHRIGHSKHPFPTTQETALHMDITSWSILKSDWLYSLQPKMEKHYIVRKTRPGNNCGSDHEPRTAKFTLKLKKVGKTTWSFRYDLNQIRYDYTMELTNRFKGFNLIECLKNYR